MRKRFAVLVAVLLLVAPFASGAGDNKGKAGGKKKGDLELAKGTWVVVSVEVDGKQIDGDKLEELKGLDLTVTGEKVVVKAKGKVVEIEGIKLTFKINPKSTPKSVDVTLHDKGGPTRIHKGIYSLEADKLTLCLGGEPGGERPTDFTTKQDSKRLLGVFKRKGK